VQRPGAGERRRSGSIRQPRRRGGSRSRTHRARPFRRRRWRVGYARDAIQLLFRVKRCVSTARYPTPRFQVSLASVNRRAAAAHLPNKADVAKTARASPRRSPAEVDTIIKHIPNNDLAIQWDCPPRSRRFYGRAGLFRRRRHRTQRRAVPHAVAAHPGASSSAITFCFGTLGGWPRFAPADLSATVDLATRPSRHPAAVSTDSHSVLPDVKEPFFAPLKNLKPRGARVISACIHHMNGSRIAWRWRGNSCRKFGLAAYCGFGRIPPARSGGAQRASAGIRPPARGSWK